MVDHSVIQLALRVKLLTLSVATTGSVSLSATTTGYARATGSFLADGFAQGMEITPSGFAANPVDTIVAVSALSIVTRNARSAESAASGRSLTVGLPSGRAWENVTYTPVTGTPYMEEQYLPGPAGFDSDGYAGLLALAPMYSPRIYTPADTGVSGDGRYADAIARLFAPGTAMALSSGDTLIVRNNPAPFRGQRFPSATPGWSCVPVTIPLQVRTVSP